jgi:hypothetical protein
MHAVTRALLARIPQQWADRHQTQVDRLVGMALDPQGYRYGLQFRPPGPGATPKGIVRVEPPIPGNGYTRHGVAVYAEPLSQEDIYNFQLVPYMTLGALTEEVLQQIAEFAQEYADDARASENGKNRLLGDIAYAVQDLKVYTDLAPERVADHIGRVLLERYAPPQQYRYALQYRPAFGGGAPAGFVRTEPPGSMDAPQEAYGLTSYGVVVYPRPLSDNEIQQSQLKPYLPMQEVVARILGTMDKYGQTYADNARKKDMGPTLARMRSTLGSLNIFTDLPEQAILDSALDALLLKYPPKASAKPLPKQWSELDLRQILNDRDQGPTVLEAIGVDKDFLDPADMMADPRGLSRHGASALLVTTNNIKALRTHQLMRLRNETRPEFWEGLKAWVKRERPDLSGESILR